MGPSALPAELALCSLVEEERTGGGVPQTEWPKQKDCHLERPCRFCFRFPRSSNSCSFPSRTSLSFFSIRRSQVEHGAPLWTACPTWLYARRALDLRLELNDIIVF